jgi:hypothetical protein
MMKHDERVAFISNHPIPADVDKFYYEVELLSQDGKTTSKYVGDVFLHDYTTD